jgi:hypothetical protein
MLGSCAAHAAVLLPAVLPMTLSDGWVGIEVVFGPPAAAGQKHFLAQC